MGKDPLVLFVDDDPVVQKAIGTFMSTMGYRHESAASCKEAVALLEAKPFSCAIVDLGLPDGNGLTLLPQIQKLHPWCVPIILSGDGSPSTIVDTVRAGAFDYLVKPADINTFGVVLERALHHHKAIRERDTLLQDLRRERGLLNSRIAEATADLQRDAVRIELANTRQKILLQLSKMSDESDTEEGLLQNLCDQLCQHLPLKCLVLTSPHAQEFFVAAMPRENQRAVVVMAEGPGSGHSPEMPAGSDPLYSQLCAAVERYTGLDVRSWTACIYPQISMERVFCTIAFLLPADYEIDSEYDAFLGTCAGMITSKWQDKRLFQYAARQASVGNLALDLSRDMMQKLTAIRTAADVILETGVMPEAAEGIRIVCENVAGLQSLLRDLRQPLLFRKNTVETVSLDRLVDQALAVLQGTIVDRGVVVDKDYLTKGQCVLFNGAALARTFVDLISSAVRAVQNNHHILLRLRNHTPDTVTFEISYDGLNSELFGVARRVTDRSVPAALGNHPKFIMAQRTIRSCGGTLSVEHKMEGRCAFQIVLPQKALSSSPELKEIGLT